jgi:hypothetical protein
MPVCAKGQQQADGSVLLVLDPLATDLTACTYVVESGADLSNSFSLMTAEDGGVFAAGLITCWLAAWGVRKIIDVIRGSQE